ncbi:hypothetical protein SAMN05444285_1382 [Draconibacterium orientale]|uniref:Uncharacterized protein n=1 Tax=Draconibacterium orientale TaxID=1168034 RepID=A0A1I0J7H4_9BACT|nr:hypothetical protein SAMN05444285_1382 [Draconibacterium orientale]
MESPTGMKARSNDSISLKKSDYEAHTAVVR